MNAPERSALWILPEGMKKCSMEKDEKIQNAATFVLRKEDHTMGNLLRHQLLRNDRVHFAGYKLPHPLEQVLFIWLII
jgi:DNA-directed RNA polymerase II subunit RPB11